MCSPREKRGRDNRRRKEINDFCRSRDEYERVLEEEANDDDEKKNNVNIKTVLRFDVVAKLKPGETLKIVGSIPELGNWDCENGLALVWSENHRWKGSIEIERLIFVGHHHGGGGYYPPPHHYHPHYPPPPPHHHHGYTALHLAAPPAPAPGALLPHARFYAVSGRALR